MSEDVEIVESVQEEKETLYDKFVSLTGLSYNSDDDVDTFKTSLCKYFTDHYPDEPANDEEDFNKLPEDVQSWVNEATSIAVKNRSAKRKKALPFLEGLDEEVAEKPKRGPGRPKKSVDQPTSDEEALEKTGRDTRANRNYRVAAVLIENPTMSDEDVVEELKRRDQEYSAKTVERAAFAYRQCRQALIDAGQLSE